MNNLDAFAQTEDYRSKEVAPTPLRQLQLAELEILKLFVSICEKHGLTYFASGGTLLGAVRHQGFIPWDDDIDITMPRSDYDRFLELVGDSLAEHIVVRTHKNDMGYVRYYARLEDMRVKVVRKETQAKEVSHAWIDLYPLDGLPSSGLLRRLRWRHYMLLRALSALSVGYYNTSKDRRLLERFALKIVDTVKPGRMLNTRRIVQRLETLARKMPYESSDYVANVMGIAKRNEIFEKKRFGDGKQFVFEGLSLHGPTDDEFINTQLYGDYMAIPDPEHRGHHHEVELVSEEAGA